MNPHHEAKRTLWNHWTPFHERSPFYALERLRKGELGLDFYGLRSKLAELGIQYVEDVPEND